MSWGDHSGVQRLPDASRRNQSGRSSHGRILPDLQPDRDMVPIHLSGHWQPPGACPSSRGPI